RALEQVRQYQSEAISEHRTDMFLPALATNLRQLAELDREPPPDAHLAVIADFVRPHLRSVVYPTTSTAESGSLALHGLIARFVPLLRTDTQGLLWYYRIVPDSTGRPEDHPAGARYADTLIGLHGSLLRAGGYLLSGQAGALPILEVALDSNRRRLL